MKRILFITIISAFSMTCKAQRVSYNDLKYVLNHNLGQVEDYLSSKGFDYIGADTSDNESQLYSSKFSVRYQNYKSDYSVSKETLNGEALSASFSTCFKSDYTAFKTAIKKLGYVMGDSKTTANGSLFIKYNKGEMLVSFFISRMKDFDTEYYVISLSNKPKS